MLLYYIFKYVIVFCIQHYYAQTITIFLNHVAIKFNTFISSELQETMIKNIILILINAYIIKMLILIVVLSVQLLYSENNKLRCWRLEKCPLNGGARYRGFTVITFNMINFKFFRTFHIYISLLLIFYLYLFITLP